MLHAKGFAVDSRKVEPGFVFFALKGEKVDGHDFLQEAKEKGALCAVVSKEYTKTVEGLELIYVGNVLSFLQDLAGKKMQEKKTKCIAVTGSVGKTTTKEFIATLLSGSFVVAKTPGNANSQVGLALSILNEVADPDIFVAEMGMSNKGEIASLVSMLPPDFAVITHIGLAHAKSFPGGLEEIAQAKAEILHHHRTKKAFIHAQARAFTAFSSISHCDLEWYADQDCKMVEEKGLWKIIKGKETSPWFSLPFTATHLQENFLGAVAVARHLGVSFAEIVERAASLSSHSMRFEVLEKKGVTYVNDAYNASPSSMRAALENMPKPKAGAKTIAVLGPMKDLGIFSEKAHEEIGEIAAKYADILLCLGEECLPMLQAFIKSGKEGQIFFSLSQIKKTLYDLVREGDVVLVKASNSLKMWTVLEEDKNE